VPLAPSQSLGDRLALPIRAPRSSCGGRTRLQAYANPRRQHRFINLAINAAGQVASAFEDAVARHAITLNDLFDNECVPIPGDELLQHRARFLDLAEKLLPDIQEPLLASDKRMVSCVAVDRNGYLPVHKMIYAKPQRPGDVR
jgi:methyl-accepting chemotaxis protein